jgi:hypothetical protein
MKHNTLRTLTRLTTTLAAAAALSACEPEDDKKQPTMTPELGQDMPVEQDMAPDATIDADLAEDMPITQELLLKGVSAQGPRALEAAAPAPLTLLLDVEGSSERTQQVSVTFTAGDKEIMQSVTYGANTLTVQPPILPDHRGPVAVSVTLDGTTVALDGGITYGASLADALPTDGPKLSQLEGIQRADDTWTLADGTLLVRQRPTQSAAPAPNLLALEDTAHTFAAFKLVDGVATPVGAPLTVELELDTVTVSADGPLLAARNAAGAIELSALKVEGDALVKDAPMFTLPADLELLSLVSYGDTTYALSERVNAGGTRIVELHNLSAGTVLGDDRLGALIDIGIVPPARGVDANGAAPVLMGRKINGDVECALIDDAQSAMLFGTLHNGDGAAPAPHALDASLIITNGKRYLGYAVDTSKGLKIQTGELVLARTVVTLIPSVSMIEPGAPHLDVFGDAEVEGNQARTYLPAFGKVRRIASHTQSQGYVGKLIGSGTDNACRRNVCKMGSALMRLPADGDKTNFSYLALPSEPSVVGGELAMPLVVSTSGTRDGKTQVVEVRGDKVASYTIDPMRGFTFAADGRMIAADVVMTGVSITQVGGERLSFATHIKNPTLVEGATAGVLELSKPLFGVVIGLNNTKKEPATPTIAGKAIGYDNPIFTAPNGPSHNVLARVSAPGANGAIQTGFFTADVEVLSKLKEGEKLEAGTNAGITLLPDGFVVDQFIGSGEDVYFLGAKSAAALYKDGRYDASLYHVTAKAKAKGEVAAPTEIMSATKLREEAADEGAEFDQLLMGDTDPLTAYPFLTGTILGGDLLARGTPQGQRMHKPIVFTKELDKSTPILKRGFDNAGSGISISGGDIILQDNSALLMGFVGGDITQPTSLTFTMDGLERADLPWIAPSAAHQRALVVLGQDHNEYFRTIIVDINGDGLADALVSVADGQSGGQGYNMLLVGQPGGGFTPVLTPDALVYGVRALASSAARKAPALADAVITLLTR